MKFVISEVHGLQSGQGIYERKQRFMKTLTKYKEILIHFSEDGILNFIRFLKGIRPPTPERRGERGMCVGRT